jgi:APA family basic amino acid/polyamine antiporter
LCNPAQPPLFVRQEFGVTHPLFLTKSVEELQNSAAGPSGFKRTLGAMDLTLLGIGCIIGTGIFVLTGRAAAANAGPAVALSFIVAGVASSLAALCYSEMASMIPVSGSAYTYAYATMGELVAWIIGWDLILEYLVGAATVSVGWSGYVVAFLHNVFGVHIPPQWTSAPFTWHQASHTFIRTGAHFNAPAVAVTLFVTAILVRGMRESARFNAIIVYIKIAVVSLFILFSWRFVKFANWHPFIPPNTGVFGQFGWSGVLQGATMVFFSYIGFDAVSAAAQETRNPQRDLPIGILASLGICISFYVVVSLILTGVVHYSLLSVPNPISVGVAATGQAWLETAVELGAIAGLSSVMLVMLMAQPRIFYAMAADGLFFRFATRLHPRFGTPHITTVATGLCCALAGGLLPIEILGELTSIGTLFAFVLVSAGIMILRIKRPEIPRSFRVPGGTYLVPVLSMGISGLLMYTATTHTIERLVLWMLVGLVFYAAYGRRFSKLRLAQKNQ